MAATDMKARTERRALEAFANLGDTLDEWRTFLEKWGQVFPDGATNLWLREVQIDQANLLSDRESTVLNMVSQWWTEYAGSAAGSPKALKPSLLFYRDMLRAVWVHNDAKGYALAILLGFHGQVAARATVPLIVPLPEGRAVVDGLTGSIEWKFGCPFQQLLYDLMKERWRTKVCPVCGRYFLAAKTAQALCSSRCFRASKRKRALDWWNREGRKLRETKSRKRRS